MAKPLDLANALAKQMSASISKPKATQPAVERMVRQADPEKRKAAAASFSKAFGK